MVTLNALFPSPLSFRAARSAVPIAAVVFPLPGPVFTIMRPRRRSDIEANASLYAERNDDAEDFAIWQLCNWVNFKAY